MRSSISYQDYQRLEQIDRRSHQTKTSLKAKLKDIWESVTAYLLASSEPYVWKTQDAAGQLWRAYDPTTGRKVQFTTEEGMRIWLEERHYGKA